MNVDNDEQDTPPGLCNPVVIDRPDSTQPNMTHRPQTGIRDNGVLIGGGSHVAVGLQNAQRESLLSGNAYAGPSTNREGPHQYQRENTALGNRHNSPAALVASEEGSTHRAFIMESHILSPPPLYPRSLTVPTASGQRPAHRPAVNTDAIIPPASCATDVCNAFKPAHVSHGMVGPSEISVTHRPWGANKSTTTAEVPQGNGIDVHLLNEDSRRPLAGADEPTAVAEPQQEGQIAAESQDKVRARLDRRMSDVADNIQYMGGQLSLTGQRMEQYSAIIHEIQRSMAEGELDANQTRALEAEREFAEEAAEYAAQQARIADEMYVAEREFNANQIRALEAEREFNANQARALEDERELSKRVTDRAVISERAREHAEADARAARAYAAQQASERAQERAQLAREREYAFEQQRVIREGQAQEDARGMEEWVIAEQNRAQEETQAPVASHREPSLTGSHTGTQRYGAFDGVFYYETPSPMPSYRPGSPRPHTTHWRYDVPSMELSACAGENEASRPREHPGCHWEGGYGHTYETQAGAWGHRYDQHYDRSNPYAVDDAWHGQTVERQPMDVSEWIGA